MTLFNPSTDPGLPFSKNEIVKATLDLPGVPAGTTGKIKMINGFSWQRYWVFFDNGIELGQLDHRELVRPNHWDHWFEQKALAAEQAAAQASVSDSHENDAGDAGPAQDDSNDPLARIRAMVPPYMLERSAAARARLSGS